MTNNRLVATFTAALMLWVVSLGCSTSGSRSGENPLANNLSSSAEAIGSVQASVSHSLLGLYECRVNPASRDIETIPLRDAMFHLNALRFLEPPPPVRMKLSNFQFDGSTIDVDVTLIHPFAGLDKYTGFDVNGIVISSGNISGFGDPALVVAGDGDTRLLNADGLTRWWNPREFPLNTHVPMWGYIDGQKGTPDSKALYTATLNGYKYFADGLGVDDDVSLLDPASRGAFHAGSLNSRHYTIVLDAGLVFNYAIDSCWLPPVVEPIVVPGSFPASANRDEPYFITANVTSNTLAYDPSAGAGSGELGLDINCYDWFNADKNTIRVESPGNFDAVTTGAVIGGTDAYSTYHVDLANPTFLSADLITIWVSAEAAMDYDGFLPGKPTAAYLPPFSAAVQESHQSIVELVWGDESVIDHPNRIPYNDIDPALIINGDGNILLSFFYWVAESDVSYNNHPLFSTSLDQGHTFDDTTHGQWEYHQIGPDKILCSNGKFTLGSNGQAFQSYESPVGHTLHPMPTFPPYTEAASLSGTPVEHAGEMLYTSEGNPMMFGDQGGDIHMQRGDFQNQGGTGTWPLYMGTPYTLTTTGGNWLSIARSSGKTSDGLCHVIFWNNRSLDYIQMISSTDSTGTAWGQPVVVFAGLADVWNDANDPSLWIDTSDGFHTVFCATTFTGEHHLMYGYSADGNDWDDGAITSIGTFPADARPNDTHVVVFDAFGETYVFIGYESGGNVWCRYKKFSESTFSDPIPVNTHLNATLPDIFPNGGTGVVFAYQADDGTGQNLTDVYYRLAVFIEK